MCAAPVRSPCANRAIRRIQRPTECHGAVWTLADNRSSKTADNASTDCWVRPESRGSLNVQSNDQPSLDAPTTIGGDSQSGGTPRYSLRPRGRNHKGASRSRYVTQRCGCPRLDDRSAEAGWQTTRMSDVPSDLAHLLAHYAPIHPGLSQTRWTSDRTKP